MLQAKTKEQKERISEILTRTSICDGGDDGIHIDDWVSYDELAALVDYLRSINNPKKSLLLDLSIVAPNMLEPVETWLAYKKEKAQSYKPTGFKTFYKKLCEFSNNNPQVAMAIIEQSMQNNYAGIFPLRNNNNNVNYGRETITDKIRRSVEEANIFSQQLTDRIGSQQQADVCDGDNDEVW
jgi:hypothetical protein